MTIYVQHFYSFYLYFCRSWIIMYSESGMLLERSRGVQSLLCVKPNSVAIYCWNGHSEMIHEHIVLQKCIKRQYSFGERVTPNDTFNTFYTNCPFLSMENARLFSVLNSFLFSMVNLDLLFVLLSIPLIPRTVCKVRQDSIKAFHWQKSILGVSPIAEVLVCFIHILNRCIFEASWEPNLLHLTAWVLGDGVLLPEGIASCFENAQT